MRHRWLDGSLAAGTTWLNHAAQQPTARGRIRSSASGKYRRCRREFRSRGSGTPEEAMDNDRIDPVDTTPWFAALPKVAAVEIDRYCENCGYNLRTQPVRRDDRTQVPLVRCPECGRYQAAAQTATPLRPWLQRLGVFGLWAWMLFLLWFGGFLLFLSGVVSYGTLHELASWRQVPQGQYQLAVRERDEYWVWFLVAVIGSSAALAFTGAWLLVVACHHWRRVAYVAPAILAPILPAVIVWLIWRDEAPHLLGWGTRYIGTHLATQWCAALIAVFAGRPLARLLARVLLPGRARTPLTFLWLADGKSPPRGE